MHSAHKVHLYFSQPNIVLFTLVNDAVTQLRIDVERHVNDGRRGERLRNGVRVAIVGEPNVGKSSLLNALSKF